MASTKTFPFLFLTLLVLNQHGSAAPAGFNPPTEVTSITDVDATAPGTPTLDSYPSPTLDSTASPKLDYDSGGAPTVTPFFTPAVFRDDYYSSPKTAASSYEEDDEPGANFDNEAASDADSVAEATLEPIAQPAAVVQTTSARNDPSVFTTSLEELGTSQGTYPTTAARSPQTTSATEDQETTQTSVEEILSLITSASWSFTPLPTQSLSQSTSGHFVMATPDVVASEPKNAASPATQMSRRAAIIGTVLAFASLVGITACVLCMRCRVPRKMRGISGGPDSFDSLSKDVEKVVVDKGTSSTSAQSSVTSLALPTLKADTINLSDGILENGSSVTNPGNQLVWQAASDSVQFEDVTHVLSEQHHVERPSSASSEGSNRISNGAPSVMAESYATCESRYSNPSIQGAISTRASSSSDEEFLSMSPSSTPSPPESPVPCTPRMADAVVTRHRSKTVDQSSSPRLGDKQRISSSKSFPERQSARMSEDLEDMIRDSTVTEGSEWDIAAAYGRFSKVSKNSVPSRATSVEVPVIEVSEDGETVDIGGRNCVLVQGYAF